MICPSCKCEYIRGVTQCADCNVALVDALESPVPETQGGQGIVSVWEGNDPGECAAVRDALEKAGIPVIDQEAAGYFIFPSMRPKTEILVPIENIEQAKKVLFDLGGTNDLEEMTDEERNSLALPDLEGEAEDWQSSVAEDPSDDRHEDDPVAEVWKGDQEEFADTLTVCLREIGIGSQKLSAGGHWRLVVRPEQEARAREIIREVVEASPPE